jgi:hypothetical protein
VAADEDVSELLLKPIIVFVELSKELEDGNLEEGVLNSSNLVLALKLKRDLPISPFYFGKQFYDLGNISLVDADGVLEKGSATQQYSMAFFLEAGGYLGEELRDIDWDSLDDFDCS